MGQLSLKLRKIVGGVAFWCPGCQELHHVRTENGGAWAYNGNADRPTFSPSVLVTSGHHIDGHKGDCWCTYNAAHPGEPAPFTCDRCHSFVTDGRIQFLSDCSHELANQTVDIPDLPTHVQD